MKNSISSFLYMIQKDCIEHGVDLKLEPGETIKLTKNMYVSGYWSDEDLELAIALDHPEWLTILAHEYGHFCQWKEDKFVDEKTVNAYSNFDSWISKKIELSDEEIDEMIKLMQKCELDCEKRALRFIKKYKLFPDSELYIQKSNSYVLGLEAAKIKRKWFKRSPSRIDKINKSMSTSFTKDLKPTKRQLNLLLKECF